MPANMCSSAVRAQYSQPTYFYSGSGEGGDREPPPVIWLSYDEPAPLDRSIEAPSKPEIT